jgi:hypothetical protein
MPRASAKIPLGAREPGVCEMLQLVVVVFVPAPFAVAFALLVVAAASAV